MPEISLSDFIDYAALAGELPRWRLLAEQEAALKDTLASVQAEKKEIEQRLADAIEADPNHNPIVMEGIVATGARKKGNRTFDTIRFAERHPEHAAWLLAHGNGSISVTGIKASRSAADDAAVGFIMPGSDEPWVEVRIVS